MNRKDIFVTYGNTPKSMINELLLASKIEKDIKQSDLIGIKPNLVVAKPSTLGATTTPEIVEGIVEYLQGRGFKNIAILEGAWIGDSTTRAFKICGYEEISKKYNVPLIDTQKDGYRVYSYNGMDININDAAMKVDFMINVPVLKAHCQTSITCALKNMKGCIPDMEKRRFHTMGLHKPIAYLNKLLRQDFIVVDGLMGDLTFEEGGNPVQMDRMIAGKDPVLIDTYGAQLLGYDIGDVPYIKMAGDIGVGSYDLDRAHIKVLNHDYNVKRIEPTYRAKELAKYIEEQEACSACYGSLIRALDRLDQRSLENLREKIHIGQGFKNHTGEGIGCGSCAKGFKNHVLGCPPRTKGILEWIQTITKGV